MSLIKIYYSRPSDLTAAAPCVEKQCKSLSCGGSDVSHADHHTDADGLSSLRSSLTSISATVPSAQAPAVAAALYRHNPYGNVLQLRLDGAVSTQRRAALTAMIANRREAALPVVDESVSRADDGCQAAGKKKNRSNKKRKPTAAPAKVAGVMCCYFKQKGHCKMGEDCWHGHEGSDDTPCHYGAGCTAGHAHLAEGIPH